MLKIATTTKTRPPAQSRFIEDAAFVDALSFDYRDAPTIARHMLAAGTPATLATIRERMAEFVTYTDDVEARGDSWRLVPDPKYAMYSKPDIAPVSPPPSTTLLRGDCLNLLREVPDGSIDLALLDLPYGSTRMAWDAIIPWQPLWTELRRVLTDTGTAVAFGSQPFTTDLIQSARDLFRYSLVWEKTTTTGFTHAKVRPLKSHEDIIVFSKGSGCNRIASPNRMTYHPQGLIPAGVKTYRKRRDTIRFLEVASLSAHAGEEYDACTNYPRSVLKFPKESTSFHPTQKPVTLLRYLIETYSNLGDIVLDPTMGSGSSGVAALNCGRHFLGMEMDEDYFAIAEDRINQGRQYLR